MTKSDIFRLLAVSFIAGIALASFYYPKNPDNLIILALLVFSLIFIAVFYKNKKVLTAGTALFVFASGIYAADLKLDKLNKLKADETFSGQVRIIKEPEIKENIQKLVVKPVKDNSDNFLIVTGAYSQYNYGDNLKVNCQLKIPENKDALFDYRMYLAKDDVYYECKSAQMEKLGINNGNAVYAGILKIKNKFNENIFQLIPAPQSGLLSGLILGGSDKLSKNVQADFSRTGLTHIVAVSGYNVTIVAEYLMILGIFIGLWRQQAFWFAVFGIILFVALTGFPSSAVRAGVMGILIIWAAKNGRLANSQNAILFSAGVMLFANPLLLRWDIGFQLSFLATLGIVYFYPLFQKYWIEKQSAFGLIEILILTLSAQIFVLPVILFNFQKLSLISPLANLLVLPIIPLTMFLGFITGFVSFVSMSLAQVFSWLVFFPLKYETLVINYLAGLKYSSIEFNLPFAGVILWYAMIVYAIYLANRKKCLGEN